MRARYLMTAFPAFTTPEDEIAKAAGVMRDREVGMLPVVEDEHGMRLVGVITDRDMAVRCLAEHHDGKCPVRAHMTSGALATVEPDDDVSMVLQLMSRAQVRRLPVVDDQQRLLGVIAQADILRKLAPEHPRDVIDVLEDISAAAPVRAHA